MLTSIARTIALFLGSFTLLNLVAEARRQHFEPNMWWIDLRIVPNGISVPLLLMAAVLWLAFGLGIRLRTTGRRVAIVVSMCLLIATAFNAGVFWKLLLRGDVTSSMPVPFSLMMATLVGIVIVGMSRARDSQHRAVSGANSETSSPLPLASESFRVRRRLLQALTLSVCAIGFPLGLMYCFGLTDYRRPADAIVVFGCKVYSDGEPSLALSDRVRTGCALYQAGLAPLVVFSGGPGEGAIHETEAMKQLAISLGVPAERIVLDPDGLNTWATVRNTSPMFAQSSVSRVLAVSHFYHLPRVKLAYQRSGWDVFTVPATETRRLRQLPFLIAREVVAFWAYYLKAVMC